MLDEGRQEQTHELIYSIKRRGAAPEVLREFRALLNGTGLRDFVAGCTELHLLVNALRAGNETAYTFIDPLQSVARAAADPR